MPRYLITSSNLMQDISCPSIKVRESEQRHPLQLDFENGAALYQEYCLLKEMMQILKDLPTQERRDTILKTCSEPNLFECLCHCNKNHSEVGQANFRTLKKSFEQMYVPQERQPFIYMSLELDPRNVQPAKHEVHFLHEDSVIDKVRSAVESKLLGCKEILCTGDNAGEMSPGSSTESYPAFAHVGLRENPGKKPQPGNLSRPGIEPGPPGFVARRANRYFTGVDIHSVPNAMFCR
ncbi:hypothetical protein ANN_10684 [Periplaneta americana]|uniref:DNA mismatch repair protein S5 domain-containing protein n=1 Tax=Periplaneta americana TaxID=6978 RepID=A0ABQ8T4L3_PERAM|nr:hypothetical protein ANN_10684 [Periplaneta americana]